MSVSDFFLGGGFAMLPVLLFSLAALAAAARYAWRPEDRFIAVLRALSAATAFTSAAALSADLAAVMHKVPSHPEWSKSPDLPLIVMMGIGESLAPPIVGFGLLGLAWAIAAAGLRRAEP